MDTDNQLLGSYANHGSERAFRTLVERHINLVHSAALRESRGNIPLAEDITQLVFTELARRATKLVGHPAVAGWLYTCVRRMAANVRRAETRRQRREQEVFTMNELLGSDPSDNLWQQVRPVLDDVMHELNEEDRTAVVLRFFEGRNLKEVGKALGLTENAARMRVERSLEKLHGHLSRRGVKSTAFTLAAAVAAGAVLIAPSALASTVATGALTTAASGGSAAFTVAKLLNLAKTKTAAASALVILTAAVAVWHSVHANHTVPEQTSQPQAAIPDALIGKPGAQDNLALVVSASTNVPAWSQMAFQLAEAETGRPLARAKLYLFYLLRDGRGKVVNAVTDASGKLGVDMPQKPFAALNMFVTADGHVPKVISWGFKRTMPAEYTMKLERGVTIGGTVVDEAGQPIAGARIEFDDPGNDQSLAENIQFGPDTKAVTDVDGRWSCNMIPKEFEQVSMVITHPEHAETTATIRPEAPEANNSTIMMKAGFTVAGAVEDASGNPIANAQVREVRWNEEGERSPKTTDAAGTFEFKGMKAGDLVLSAEAKGFAPTIQTLQINSNVAALRFQLGPGQLLRGRVTSEDGNPISNAWVETTRGQRKFAWSATTDANGRFEWDSAPQEPMLYSVLAEGFNLGYGIKLSADGSEHEIKLNREQSDKDYVEITGTVGDADTGLPLDSFKVMVGEIDPGWAYPLDFGATGKDGEFSLSLSATSSHRSYQLQIEKDGYVPAVSAELSRKAGKQTFDFKLQRGSGPAGVVFLPNGEPAANATVLLCTPRGGVTIDGPAHVEKGLNTTTCLTQTDEAGKFSLAAVVAPQALAVIHDQGYALVGLEAAGNITLQPWGRVEGSLMLDGEPVANQTIVAGNQTLRYDDHGRHFNIINFRFETKTDASGKFAFDKVPPGECSVFWEKRTAREPRFVFGSHNTPIVVKPGAVAQAVLGGTGKEVIGSVSMPDITNTIDWQGVPVRLGSKIAGAPDKYPARDDFASNEAFIEAMKRWDKSMRVKRTFVTFCESNGSFRLMDVPAGTYELKITLRNMKPDSVSPDYSPDPTPAIGSLIREVIVPENSGRQSAGPVDLGTLALKEP